MTGEDKSAAASGADPHAAEAPEPVLPDVIELPRAWSSHRGEWFGIEDAPTMLHIQVGAREAALCHAGKEFRFSVADGDLVALLHMAFAVHADIPVPAWPAGNDGPDDGPSAGAAREVALHGRLRSGQAVAMVVESGLHHVLANVRPALAGHVEAVHQQRVALRRLRAALALFQPCLQPSLQPGPAEAVRAELGRLGRVLGAARDWDVFCLDILPGLPGDVLPEAERQRLQDAAGDHRRITYQAVSRDLDDVAIAALVGSVTGWLSAKEAVSGVPEGQLKDGRLKDIAPDLLSRLERNVRHRGRHIARRSEDELHALRKAAKQLRYGVAFLQPLFKAKLVKPYLHAAEQLQACLGELNDLANGARLARELGVDSACDGAATTVAAHLNGRKAAAADRARDGWRLFSTVDPFWA